MNTCNNFVCNKNLATINKEIFKILNVINLFLYYIKYKSYKYILFINILFIPNIFIYSYKLN